MTDDQALATDEPVCLNCNNTGMTVIDGAHRGCLWDHPQGWTHGEPHRYNCTFPSCTINGHKPFAAPSPDAPQGKGLRTDAGKRLLALAEQHYRAGDVLHPTHVVVLVRAAEHEAGLDVERLAAAIGALWDSPLGFPTDDRIAARNLAREYAALSDTEETR